VDSSSISNSSDVPAAETPTEAPPEPSSFGRFCAKALLFLSLQGIIAAMALSLGPAQRADFVAAAADKEALFLQSPSPRAVFVGGSNLPFGLDGATLRDQTGLNPINMALHIHVGPELMLQQMELLDERADPKRREILVLSMEYQLFQEDADRLGFYVQFDFLSALPRLWKRTYWRQPGHALDQSLVVLGGRLRFCLLWALAGEEMLKDAGVYRRDAFDAFGNIKLELLQGQKLVDFGLSVSEKTIRPRIERLNKFARAYRREGVEVVWLFPPLPEYVFGQHEKSLRLVADEMKRLAEFPILNAPEDVIYPNHVFFDTPYHLNAEGVVRRTAEVAQALRPFAEKLGASAAASPELHREPAGN
jgi:hypothetical protein